MSSHEKMGYIDELSKTGCRLISFMEFKLDMTLALEAQMKDNAFRMLIKLVRQSSVEQTGVTGRSYGAILTYFDEPICR